MLSLLVLAGLFMGLLGSSGSPLAQECSVNFYLDPAFGSAPAGGSTAFWVVRTAAGPCSWGYSVALTSAPFGISAAFDPAGGVVYPDAPAYSQATVFVDPAVPGGQYELMVFVSASNEWGETVPFELPYYLEVIAEAVGEPDIEVSPPQIDFGEVPVGAQYEGRFSIFNAGNAPLTVESIAIRGGFKSPFNFCIGSFIEGFVLEPGQFAEYPVCFTPPYEGQFQDAVEITSNDPDEPHVSILLSGHTPVEMPRELWAWLTTDRGCVEEGRTPSYQAGESVFISFGISGPDFAFVTLHLSRPDGSEQTLFQQEIPRDQTLSAETAAGPQTGLHVLVLLAQAEGQEAWVQCSFFVEREAPPPPPPPPTEERGRISGSVFEDKDGDGRRDPDEPGLPGWEVFISGPESTRVTTDFSGEFSVTVPPGEYEVSLGGREGWQVTTGTSYGVALEPGGSARIDFGVKRIARVLDRSLPTVYSVIHRFRQDLHLILEDDVSHRSRRV